MLHILLLILKIIGILLAAVISLLLLSIIFVLFVPIRYRIEADGKLGGKEPLWMEIKITWLLRIISVIFSYPGNAGLKIKIAGIPVFNSSRKRKKGPPKSKKEKKKPVEGKGSSEKEENSDSEKKPGKEENPQKDDKSEKDENSETKGFDGEESIEDKENNASDNESAAREAENAQTQRNPLKKFFSALLRLFRKLLDAIRNIEYTIQELCGKIKSTMENIRYYTDLLQGEIFRSAFQNAKGQLFRILRMVKPRKCRVNLLIGLDDPAGTGQIMAIYGMLYPLIGQHVFVQADFEEKIVEGDLYIKGKITFIVFLIAALKLYMDKNVRKLLKMLKREDA